MFRFEIWLNKKASNEKIEELKEYLKNKLFLPNVFIILTPYVFVLDRLQHFLVNYLTQ